jgi:hypothetical protein
MSDRRHPARQRPDPDGERVTDPVKDPWLNTAQCAALLGVSPAFVVGEIHEGRLIARIQIQRPQKRTIYRLLKSDLELYLRQYNWAGQNTRTAQKR